MNQQPAETGLDFEQVRRSELERIVQRRKIAFRDDQQDPQNTKLNLVGLALSGGGIRSAAISLGVLQSLSKKGILPFVDFLSTVSGGGYAGGYLSTVALSAASEHRQPVNDDATNPTVNGRTDSSNTADVHAAGSFASLPNGEQPERIQRFIFGSRYLRSHFAFASRYASTLLVMLTMYLSGLLMASALVAYCYGQLWQPQSVAVIHALGFQTDIGVALFPAFVIMILWMMAWAISYFRYAHRSSGHIARVLFVVFLFVSAVGIAGLFGTGDISLTQFSTPEISAPKKVLGSFGDTLQILLYSAIGAGLLPYLSPRNLLRSGTAPRNNLDRATFWVASRALVFGIPFVFVAWFTQENLSGFNESRGGKLYFADFEGWKTKEAWSPFWIRIKNSALRNASDDPAAPMIWNETKARYCKDESDEKRTWTRMRLLQPSENAADGVSMKSAFGSLDIATVSLANYERKATFGRGWWQMLQYNANMLLGNREDAHNSDFSKYLRNRWNSRIIKEGITLGLNETLEKPEFTIALKGSKDYKERAQKDQNWARKMELLETRSPDEITPSNKKAATFAVNRQLLEELYGDDLTDPSIVYSSVVLAADQKLRLNWFCGTAPVFLFLLLIVNLNATSLHGFYSHEISKMWLDDVPGMPETGVTLAKLNTVDAGFPYHLISATWHRLGRRETAKDSSSRELFLFSHLFCGTDRLGYASTASYMRGQYVLADALGVSGGALSPLQVNQPLVMLLLILANVRLGQWIDNPSVQRAAWTKHLPFSSYLPYMPLKMLLSMLWKAEDRDRCFLSDGGLYENLGIEPLLRRRCKLIIAIDAGQDEEYEFGDLSKLIRWAQVRHGVRLEAVDVAACDIDLSPLIPSLKNSEACSHVVGVRKDQDGGLSWAPQPVSGTHHLVFRIRYPQELNSPQDAYLVYVKSSITGDEPQALLGHLRRNKSFPHDSTTNQYFDSTTFESYRHLGSHMADSAFAADYGNLRSSRTASSAYDRFFKQLMDESTIQEDAGVVANAELDQLLQTIRNTDLDPDEREAAIIQLSECPYDTQQVIRSLVEVLGDDSESLIKSAGLVLTEYGCRAPRLFVELGMQTDPTPRIRIELATLAPEILGQDVDTDQQILNILADWSRSDKPKTLQKAARGALREFCFAVRHDARFSEQVAKAKQALRSNSSQRPDKF
ncbi:MAG: patatin-like phospholipase family protein [Planctomycetaceae bacterium]|nr:patatin-like phospholipase family protein [Planctomycetales bacterium]MCB9927078.1 patatin-like phospholipase family protein [Planctomycetaceae bacterium]